MDDEEDPRPIELRAARPTDRDAAYAVCLRTGDHGRDATGTFRDKQLLGHVYVGPYLALEPDHCYVLDAGTAAPGPTGVVGYVVAASDTVAFERRLEREWWPQLRARYPQPQRAPGEPWTAQDRLVHHIHHPARVDPGIAGSYPSHLHIDLLPAVQRQGYGRWLMDTVLSGLAGSGSRGVHLGVSSANPGAKAFYHRLGFTEVVRRPERSVMARSLP